MTERYGFSGPGGADFGPEPDGDYVLFTEFDRLRGLLLDAKRDLRIAAKCMAPSTPAGRQFTDTANRIDAALGTAVQPSAAPKCPHLKSTGWGNTNGEMYSTCDMCGAVLINTRKRPTDNSLLCTTCGGKGYVPRNNPLHPFVDKRCPDCCGDRRTPP